MTASSLFSLVFLLLIISLFSAALASTHGLNDQSLIQQVVSSDGHDHDILMSAYHQFSSFKKEYNKTYLTQEEDDYRFGVFMSNLLQARRNQNLDPTAIHGVTKFSDLTPSEFCRKYLRLDGQIQLPKHLKTLPILPTDNLPTAFDWRDDDAVTGVKDQGSCGACWAFASIATVETAHFLANDKLVDMSEQQLIDCSHECTDDKVVCNRGCKGGKHILAYSYMLKVGGVEAAKDYPYTGIDTDSCKFDENKIVASIYDFNNIVADEDQYAANLVEYGTVAVRINGSMMQTYTGGIACPPCSDNFNHEVTLVGYGSDRHWIIKNSWGTDFGENGYYMLCKGKLTCGKNPEAIIPFANMTKATY
ncbi:hypothetical protein ACOSQ2_011328 [Xanthoceras sorbifolium]|uniref:Uncharacterized protein n=1 Tax=Xanthoceras sorbifolium TaxID=99658 RepID=A0ABQ8HS90_9ROSI|nr:hypothetical protein JRO89_XS07G0029700 [Xanthoceras sorbifolium]